MKNILVIKHGSLGDIVQINGALKDLRSSFADHNILLLTSPLYQELMIKCPYINDIILDDRKLKWNPLNFLKLRKKLNSYKFSHVFDLQNSKRTEIYNIATFMMLPCSVSITIFKHAWRLKGYP